MSASRRIFTLLDYNSSGDISFPALYFKRCRSKDRILEVLNNGLRADGVVINTTGNLDNRVRIRLSKYINGQVVAENDFIILREVLETKILTGAYISLNIFVCPAAEPFLLLGGSSVLCNNIDETGDGIKVKIPTPGAR